MDNRSGMSDRKPSGKGGICLFSDTVGDINGVSRFIQNVAQQAREMDKPLHVIASTRFECPDVANIHDFKPVWRAAMPGYETLDVVLPAARAMKRLAMELEPDVVHVSTPGPVGSVGRKVAKRLDVPMLGVYHTDFPAYIEHLFDDEALTWVCGRVMRNFYKPFARVFTRSEEYRRSLLRVGIPDERIVRLLPGIDTKLFSASYRDESSWERVGVGSGVKVLYVGRVSVEKNLPMLVDVWKRADAMCRGRGAEAELVVVGDGPYRARMEAELSGTRATFLGFRHGEELARLYASADIFAFPSTTDTLGQVVMESQSVGLAVIVTDQGGPAGVVDDGVTGFVVPADQPGVWAERIVELAEDEDKRKTMGRAGIKKMAPMTIQHSFLDFWRVHEEAAAESGGSLAQRAGWDERERAHRKTAQPVG